MWPGFGDSGGEDVLEDMLDFALHGADVVVALGLDRPQLYGHSFGGMIAAEMAALAPASFGALGSSRRSGCGSTITRSPTSTPCFRSSSRCTCSTTLPTASVLTDGVDFEDQAAVTQFLIANSRRLGTAGKVLFPIPNRRLSKRLYRVTNPVAVVWGASDRLMPPVYAERWAELLPQADVTVVDDAGHMAPYEQPSAVAAALAVTYD